jgi:SAM-dependent methyltransferase
MFDADGTAAEHDARYYDLFTDWRKDADFFVGLARKFGGPILELGCATGRITHQIAAAGLDIDGLELSAARLKVAEERLRGPLAPGSGKATFFHGDMRDFALPRRYRQAMFPYRVLQELASATDKIACLECVHGHLEDGGLIVIDNYDPSIPYLAQDPAGSERSVEKVGPADETVRRTDRVLSRDYATQTQQLEVEYEIRHIDGTPEHVVIPYETSYVFRFELEHLLSRCGFVVREVWGGFGFEPFGAAGTGELIVLAERI